MCVHMSSYKEIRVKMYTLYVYVILFSTCVAGHAEMCLHVYSGVYVCGLYVYACVL